MSRNTPTVTVAALATFVSVVWNASFAMSWNLVEVPATPAAVPFGVASQPWPESLGNLRARLQVQAKADAVWAHLPWRRRAFSRRRRTSSWSISPAAKRSGTWSA